MLIGRLGFLHFGFLRRLSAIAILLGIHSAAYAVGWYDNFNDGNVTVPVAWLEDLGGSGFFPGVYDASSGDYLMDPDEASPTGTMLSLVPAVGSADWYMRTKGMVIPSPVDPFPVGGNLVLIGRVDPGALTGYYLYFDSSANLNIGRSDGGATSDIGVTYDAPFNALSDAVIELHIVGDDFYGFVWREGEGRPEAPQVTTTDATYAAPGIAGLAFDIDDAGTSGIYRWAGAQDAPFVSSLDGDYNGNFSVDAADLVLVAAGVEPLPLNEIVGIGTTDGADRTAALALFGNADASDYVGGGPGLGNGAAVPEPTGLFLALAGLVAGLLSGRRQR